MEIRQAPAPRCLFQGIENQDDDARSVYTIYHDAMETQSEVGETETSSTTSQAETIWPAEDNSKAAADIETGVGKVTLEDNKSKAIKD